MLILILIQIFLAKFQLEILLELVKFKNSVVLPVTNKNNYNIIQYDVYNKRKN